ncbi:MAG: acyltransferase family protein [Methylovulum sp.]|jgi:peptidoglycan/LPS O-acetylase OafA/YrhL
MIQHRKYFSFLDSVRGLAAVSVVNEHFVIAYGLPCKAALCSQWLDNSPLHIWWDGTAAVSMFFVLSGFVLSINYVDTNFRVYTFKLVDYFLKRVCRIVLPYLAVLLVSACAYKIIISQPLLITTLAATDWINLMWRGHPLTAFAMLREAFIFVPPTELVLVPQSWTLAIELVMSLLLPVGLLFLENSLAWLVFFTCFAVLFLNVSLFLVHFLLGILLARYHQKIIQWLKKSAWVRYSVFITALFFYTITDSFAALLNDPVIWLTTALGSTMLLSCCLSSEKMQNILGHASLKFVGQVSYSLYLIHMLVLICITPFMLQLIELFIDERAVVWLCGWVSTLLVSLFLANYLYQWIEKPSINFAKHLIYFKDRHRALLK